MGTTNGTNAATVAAAAAAARTMLPLESLRCIRETMVRSILLSSKPLKSHEFVDIVKREYHHHQATTTVPTKSTLPQEAWSNKGSATRVAASVRESDVEVYGEAGTQSPIAYLLSFLSSASKESGDTSSIHDAASSCPVEATVRLLLAIDSQFRISPAGYVCYPNLPSLFLASTNVEQDDTWLQVGRQIVRADEARPCSRGGEHGCRAAISAVAGELTRWTYMLSLWFMLDAFTEADDGNAATDGLNTHDGASVSKRLMQHWVAAFDERELPPLLLQEVTTGGGWDISSARSVSSSLELRETLEGSDVFRRWCSEAKEGYLGDILVHAPQLTQSQPLLLQQVNDQLGYFFVFVLGAPIPLGRLSALMQWASLPFASHYRSLLHFLLLYVGNPAVAQMERQLKRRREANKRWTNVLRSRLLEDQGRHWHPDKRHPLVGRYASREYKEKTPDTTELTAAPGGNDTKRTSGGKSLEVGLISSEQCALWLRNGSGSLVNPKITDVCRCLFLQPEAMTPLEVTTQTPSEVLESFEAVAAGSDNDVVVFSLLPYVFERRVCRVIRAWWALEGQYTTATRPSGAIAVIPVQRLCQLCLWEHEYGAAAANKMMLHYLRSVITAEAVVQLVPPPALADATATSTEDAGRWLVVLRPMTEER
ncbi:hypothetical protein TraAM80_02946 [Trypanosoma rangeli]|uniref:Uncharacterized protein n=1 Tax=Trypanosoma rangeli TaxID=5698 RepID=A0A3R7KHZ8_TRYRA|nr:uncharacterized protein TraAM80_02946 [Trypanosoma rangeli]RNF08014.1 hypothetical protein TraAM80_02946 [Trypanosoma rangeli]|eukprot:RNF08014.1 hypothetical protein TraAM80_02946 [Trypanosoma rangeli]